MCAFAHEKGARVPTNEMASEETRNLYVWLLTLRGNALLGISKESDRVFLQYGKRPGLLGVEYYDYGPVERKLGARQKTAAAMIEHYRLGGVLTLHDHIYNFGGVTARTYAPEENHGLRDRSVMPLPDLLPGGRYAAEYRAYLRRLAAFMRGIQFEGTACPILFRPFHEMNGEWFWWGGVENAADLVKVWQYTHKILVQDEKINHLLWVWSPNVRRRTSINPSFDVFWPGRGYVDIVGLDGYDDKQGGTFSADFFKQSYEEILMLAKREQLPFGWTEIGFAESGRNTPGFWTEDVLASLQAHFPEAKFVLIWHGKWLPYTGTPAAYSMREMFNDPYLLTLEKLGRDVVYGKAP